MQHILHYDPSPQEFSSHLLTPLLKNFHTHFQSVAIPLLKLQKTPHAANATDINAEDNAISHSNSSINSASGDMSRFFLVRQLTRVSRYLRNLAEFREFLNSAVLAKEVWWLLCEHCASGLARLLQHPLGDEQVCIPGCIAVFGLG